MKNKLSPLTLFQPGKLKVLLSLGFKGYLADKGWFEAYRTKSSISETGDPIAWVTYSFIDFIKERINKQHSVFEFGSGNSTLFYSKLSREVYSVEHDKGWFEKNSGLSGPNIKMIYCELTENGPYCRSALDTGKKFDVIIVDGRDRLNCCEQAIKSLTEDGVVVLDDSERKEYGAAFDFFKRNGFKHLPFTGMAPGVIVSKCTSIFYKSNNCLDI
ncbi:FkbM family methyltransferase [Pedobacter steynii]|uniref:FkbM family methyltransferase n=1 Tax=Pedobacter steynii TaxID=430522 RepID=A0A1D7QPY1_9SPHI|nr:FkbM family methyltransferase [Pedobacter steynii]AOM80675.1 FkbM family methyltransferase [Pedobacter steynii]